jgi:flagellar protein FlbD
MIRVTTLSSEIIYINPDLIEKITQRPNTVLVMTTNKNIVVRETAEEVYQKILKYRQEIMKILTEVIIDEEA